MTDAAMAYRALSAAAVQIGAANYAAGRGCVVRRAKGRPVRMYSPTAAHRMVMQAMPDVLAGRITPEEAMALLWVWDVARERGVHPTP